MGAAVLVTVMKKTGNGKKIGRLVIFVARLALEDYVLDISCVGQVELDKLCWCCSGRI